MDTIWRFSLPITDRPMIDMPRGAHVLSSPPSSRNDSQIEIWAQVDTDQSVEKREFRIVGTGNPAPDDCGRFVGSVITHGGVAVWHVYEANVL